MLRWLLIAFSLLLLDGCSQQAVNPLTLVQPRLAQTTPVKPKYEPLSHYGNPAYYHVNGERYTVLHSPKGYRRRGIASWYGPKFNGQLTSTRERFDMYKLTAASPVLPLPCYARVTNLNNGRQIIVRVNDRGPFAKNRIMDLSYAAAKKLGFLRHGTALVEVAAINIKNPNAIAPTVVPAHPHLYLQLGAFTNYHNAVGLQQTLHQYTTRPIHIYQGTFRQRPIYRVQIGPLLSVDQSDKLQTKFAREGLGHAVTKIR